MSESTQAKLRRVARALEEGRIPRILSPLPGLDKLLRSYGLKPGVDVYIPDPNLSPAENSKRRAQIRSKRFYRKTREEVGEYSSRQERLRQKADELLEHNVPSLTNPRQKS